MDRFGLDGGSHIIINSGCMSTSAGPMQGASKATGLAYIMLTFEIPYAQSVNLGGAWTSVDLKDISRSRVPVMMSLADACDKLFWVSFFFFLFFLCFHVR